MSDEPRTDAIVHRRICYGATRNDMKVIEAFARQLERELSASLSRENGFYNEYRRTHAALLERNEEIARLRDELASKKATITQIMREVKNWGGRK